MAKRILVVEDETSVRDGLLEALTDQGYEAVGARTGEEALSGLEQETWDLWILDVRLPGISGFEVCRELRQVSKIPVLFLTAYSDEANTVKGLELGGDDYVAKPFRLKELLSRVAALLRRSGSSETDTWKSGNLIFDRRSRRIERDGEEIPLTPKEGRVAWLLMRAWPEPVSRDELVRLVWDKHGQFIEDNTVRVHVSRLRDKLGMYEGKAYLETVRYVGYRWTVPVER